MNVSKQPHLIRNAIQKQVKKSARTITVAEWNAVVNTLKEQANANTKYLQTLHRALFYNYTPNDSGPIEELLNTDGEFLRRAYKVLEELENGLVEGTFSKHNAMSASSRALPNAHPISAITGLTEAVGVHIGVDAPAEGDHTWFETISDEQDINNWSTLLLSTEISIGDVLTFDPLDLLYPVRLKVIGSINGDNVEQFIYSEDGIMTGEIIIHVDDNVANTIIVDLEIAVTQSSIEILNIVNKGATLVDSVLMNKLEVYN